MDGHSTGRGVRVDVTHHSRDEDVSRAGAGHCFAVDTAHLDPPAPCPGLERTADVVRLDGTAAGVQLGVADHPESDDLPGTGSCDDVPAHAVHGDGPAPGASREVPSDTGDLDATVGRAHDDVRVG